MTVVSLWASVVSGSSGPILANYWGGTCQTSQVQHVSQIAAVPETIEREISLFHFTLFSPHAVEYKFLSILLTPGEISSLSPMKLPKKFNHRWTQPIGNCRYIHPIAQPEPACAIEALQLLQNAAARLVFNLPSSPTLHRTSAPWPGYQWVLESDSRHWYLATMLQMAQAHPTSRTWSNLTPQPVHYILLLPNGLLLPHYEGTSATTQQNHDCLLSWLHNALIVSRFG